MRNKLNKRKRDIVFGIIMPIFVNPIFWNMVKPQIPLNRVKDLFPSLFEFVSQQSGFVLFGALTLVGALFYLKEKRPWNKKQTKD